MLFEDCKGLIRKVRTGGRVVEVEIGVRLGPEKGKSFSRKWVFKGAASPLAPPPSKKKMNGDVVILTRHFAQSPE